MFSQLRRAHECRSESSGLQRARQLGRLARQALIAEAELTPKPGLVDRRGSGAHTDLSLDVMRRSAVVLEPYFAEMGLASRGRSLNRDLREELAAIGRDAERAMYETTQGSNSHKGAIWALGLLVAAAAWREDQNASEIAAAAGVIARFQDRARPTLITHGDRVRHQYGARGARGEASNGFPTVVEFGLPILRERREAVLPEEVCRLDALLGIMSQLDDTCILHRGGREALEITKAGAQAALAIGRYDSSKRFIEVRRLDHELLKRRISPGGSADLLAATIFLDAVDRRESEVRKDRSE